MTYSPEESGMEASPESVRQELYNLLEEKFPEQSDHFYNPGVIVEDVQFANALTVARQQLEIQHDSGDRSEVLYAYTIARYDTRHVDEPDVWLYVAPNVLDEGRVEYAVSIQPTDEATSESIDESSLLSDIKLTLKRGIYTEGLDGLPPDLYMDYGDTALLVGMLANEFYGQALHDRVSFFLRSYTQEIPLRRIQWDLRRDASNDDNSVAAAMHLTALETSTDIVRGRTFRTLELAAEWKDDIEVKVRIRLRFDAEGQPRNTHIEFLSQDENPMAITPKIRGMIHKGFRFGEIFPPTAVPLDDMSQEGE